MKHFPYILALFIGLIAYQVNAQSPELDSSAYSMTPLFTTGDSIVLTSTAAEQVIYPHVLKQRQTLYSLSNFFGWDVFSLYDFNPQLNKSIAEIGDTILVPVNVEDIVKVKNPYKAYYEVYYRVKKKDTPFAVRHRMFNMSKELFYERNPSAKDEIDVGSYLFIGYFPIHGVKTDSILNLSPLISNDLKKMATEFHKYKPEMLAEARGMAYWNPSAKGQQGFYAICNMAPINSYIKITNPMYNRSAYAKVVSHIPDNRYQNRVIIIVSSSLANYLGVMDSRFFVKLRYLQEQE